MAGKVRFKVNPSQYHLKSLLDCFLLTSNGKVYLVEISRFETALRTALDAKRKGELKWTPSKQESPTSSMSKTAAREGFSKKISPFQKNEKSLKNSGKQLKNAGN